jgi:hypothetical protein
MGVFDLLRGLSAYVTSKGKVDLSLTMLLLSDFSQTSKKGYSSR